MVAMILEGIVHHLLDRVRVERSRRDDDEAQRVADQVDQRLVLQQLWILLEDRRAGGVLDMRLDRDRPFGPHHLHQGGDEEDAVEIVGLLVRGATKHLADAAGGRSEEHTSELQSTMRIPYSALIL